MQQSARTLYRFSHGASVTVGALPEEFLAFAEEVNDGPRRVLSPFFVGLFGDGKEL
jgi:hypothetical protein